MNILAIDTASVAASVAISENGRLLCELFSDTGLTHSQTIMPMVDQALSMAGKKLSSMDRLAVTIGPGSFTGLRIGIGTVKGLAMGADLPVVGVSTLKVIAHNALPTPYLIAPIMDARRNQVYNALYRGENLEEIMPPRALGIDELVRELHEPTVFVGDGVAPHRAYLMEALGENALFVPKTRILTRASSCGALAETMDAIDAGALAPSYIRLSQAEREYNEKNQKG